MTGGLSPRAALFRTGTPAVSANRDGQGIVALPLFRVIAGVTSQIPLPAFRCRATPGELRKRADPTRTGHANLRRLYGTRIRGGPPGSVAVLIDGATVPLLYARPQREYDALDEIIIELPLTLCGADEVDVVVDVGGVLSNTARMRII